jgi:hypothetical protein
LARPGRFTGIFPAEREEGHGRLLTPDFYSCCTGWAGTG